MLDNQQDSQSSVRTSVLGASLTDMLQMTCGELPSTAPQTEATQKLFDELRPKYDSDEIREKIEQNCRYNTIKPHLLDASTKISDPIPVLSRYGSVIASEGNICVQLMRENYPNGVERKVLTTKLVDSEDMNRAYARVKIARAIAKGIIIERGGVLYLP